MRWLKAAKKWRDDRVSLVRLNEEERDLRTTMGQMLKDEGLTYFSDELRELDNEYVLIRAAIAEIEDRRALFQAERWQIPVPTWPRTPEEESENWEWHSVHGRFYLSDKGKAYIRREVYQEREMRAKPFLSWAAIGISVVSLAVAVLKP